MLKKKIIHDQVLSIFSKTYLRGETPEDLEHIVSFLCVFLLLFSWWFQILLNLHIFYANLEHAQTDQGIKNLPAAEAAALTGTDPDYAIRDLYNAIADGNFPSWTFYIQVMTFQQAEEFRWNPFDVTKVSEFRYVIIESFSAHCSVTIINGLSSSHKRSFFFSCV
jgi:hypothetical protein